MMGGIPKPVEQAPTFVGAITAVIGSALLLAPGPAGRAASLEPGPARVFGAADLSLVPGLLLARRRGPWMAARGVMNLAMAAYYLVAVRPRDPKAARRTAAILCGLTVADGATARALLRAERHASG